MLKIHKCASPADKQLRREHLDPKTQAWIVSDLQSKWHLQEQLLQEKKVLEEQAVLRASEFWRKASVQILPSTRLLSAELAQSLFWNWVEPLQLPWMRTPSSLRVLLQQMRSWIGVFADPQGPEQMAAWFQENPESFVRWGQWFELSRVIWEKCVEHNVILPNWLPALLLHQDLSRLEIPKHLIFDLGVQMTPVEALLVQELGRHFDVDVIEPETVWSPSFHQPLYAYQVLEGRGRPRAGDFDWSHLGRESLRFVRYSTRVAEVKAAVARVREWLEQGVPPARIAVIAPDIEEHWPLLSLYLEQEGIFTRKNKVARLHSFPVMTKWLAQLRIALSQLSTADLEASLFLAEDSPGLPFEEFRVLYSMLYGPEDLGRSEWLAERWRKPHFSDEPMTQEEFFASAVRFWRVGEGRVDTVRGSRGATADLQVGDHSVRDGSADSRDGGIPAPSAAAQAQSNAAAAQAQALLEKFTQFITQDVPRRLQLRPREWLNYWQGILSRIEIPLSEELADGIWCVSLSSTDWLDLSHGVFLNMSAASLRQLTQSPVRFSELEKLSQDLGYPVDSPDQQQSEFEFLWLAEKNWREFVCSFAQTDTEGAVLTPSRLWLWGASLHGEVPREAQMPGVTRWDELQKNSVAEIAKHKNWSADRVRAVEQALVRDEGHLRAEWGPLSQVKLSASSLEDYLTCPFIFAAKRVLKLSDHPVMDLDLDRMSRGKLMHALFARLMKEPVRFDWSDEDLKTLITEAAASEKIQIGEPGLWPATVRAHLQLARTLLEMEREWRQRFPETRTLQVEKDFICAWDLEAGRPVRAEVSANPPITIQGRVDRIDGAGDRYAVIDYKSSSNGLTNWGGWLKNDSLQMALYAQMVEEGFTDLPPGEVEAAHYMSVKQKVRAKGFFLKEAAGALFDPADFHYTSLATRADVLEQRRELNEKISQAIRQILAGEFHPEPKDGKTCSSCHWRRVCRNPELN